MIVVTAATGHFGRLAVEALLERVPATELRLVVRSPAKAADFAARGVEVVEGDYTKPETLVQGFAGADKLLFVSSTGTNEERLVQHLNVVSAAKEAGVGRVFYTSIPQAETNPLELASVHKATEAAITESGIPATFLRNNWYFENTTGNLAAAIEHGALIGASGEGRTAYATRADYAEAAAAAVTADGAVDDVYELTGDHAYTQGELAAEVARQAGKEVAFVNLPQDEYAKALAGFGVPEHIATLLADADVKVAEGALATTTGDLAKLLGRPTTTLAEAVSQALKG